MTAIRLDIETDSTAAAATRHLWDERVWGPSRGERSTDEWRMSDHGVIDAPFPDLDAA